MFRRDQAAQGVSEMLLGLLASGELLTVGTLIRSTSRVKSSSSGDNRVVLELCSSKPGNAVD